MPSLLPFFVRISIPLRADSGVQVSQVKALPKHNSIPLSRCDHLRLVLTLNLRELKCRVGSGIGLVLANE